MQFGSLGEYIEAFSKNRELAVVPIPLVADYLKRTAPAVTAMIATGRLEEIRIGKNRFVALKSLLDRKEAYEKQVAIVRQYLMKMAKSGKRVIFYEEVMAQVGMSTKVPADRTKIGDILGQISDESFDNHRVLLSVLVHRKSAGITNPGPGFFQLAENRDFKWKDDNDFVKQHTDKVLKVYK